jgi:hypothetical protein
MGASSFFDRLRGDVMKIAFSNRLSEDIVRTLEFAIRDFGIANIPVLAEQIRKRNEAENVALEDIMARLTEHALLRGAAMEFDSASLEPQNGHAHALP